MALGLVIAMDTSIHAAKFGCIALKQLVDQFESGGISLEIVIVNVVSDADVVDFLQTMEGARVVDATSLTLAQAYASAISKVAAPYVLFGSSSSNWDANYVGALEANLGDDDVLVATPERPALCLAQNGETLSSAFENSTASMSWELFEDVASRLGSAAKQLPKFKASKPTFDGHVSAARPGSVAIGAGTYSGEGVTVRTWTEGEEIYIGKYNAIGENVRILHPGLSNRIFRDHDGNQVPILASGEHRMETASLYTMGALLDPGIWQPIPRDGTVLSQPLVIGHNCWIGFGAVIMGAITIGNGAVVTAGSVVVRDVPAYSVVMGNPAQVIKKRFSDEVCEGLDQIAWWNWSEDEIEHASEWFLRPAQEFVDHFLPLVVN